MFLKQRSPPSEHTTAMSQRMVARCYAQGLVGFCLLLCDLNMQPCVAQWDTNIRVVSKQHPSSSLFVPHHFFLFFPTHFQHGYVTHDSVAIQD